MTLMIYKNKGNSHIQIHINLSNYVFKYQLLMRIFDNSSPIGLALMVAISEVFLQCLEDKVMKEALVTNLALLIYKRYVDDSHARFKTVHQTHSFLNILNKQNFLYVTIINNGAWKYEFKILGKNAIANVQIKLHSYMNPVSIRAIFKEFVSRAKKLCSEKFLDEELNFLIDMFAENRHDQNYLNSIIRENKHQAPKT